MTDKKDTVTISEIYDRYLGRAISVNKKDSSGQLVTGILLPQIEKDSLLIEDAAGKKHAIPGSDIDGISNSPSR